MACHLTIIAAPPHSPHPPSRHALQSTHRPHSAPQRHCSPNSPTQPSTLLPGSLPWCPLLSRTSPTLLPHSHPPIHRPSRSHTCPPSVHRAPLPHLPQPSTNVLAHHLTLPSYPPASSLPHTPPPRRPSTRQSSLPPPFKS